MHCDNTLKTNKMPFSSQHIYFEIPCLHCLYTNCDTARRVSRCWWHTPTKGNHITQDIEHSSENDRSAPEKATSCGTLLETAGFWDNFTQRTELPWDQEKQSYDSKKRKHLYSISKNGTNPSAACATLLARLTTRPWRWYLNTVRSAGKGKMCVWMGRGGVKLIYVWNRFRKCNTSRPWKVIEGGLIALHSP